MRSDSFSNILTVKNIIEKFQETETLIDEQFTFILSDLRTETIKFILRNPNREFAKALLKKVIDKRVNEEGEEGNGDNIMFACYLLGMHGKVEDSILVWQAKNTDFDSFSYVDIQLMVFAGVKQTLDYLNTLQSKESTDAINYLNKCSNAGDFDSIESYFSKNYLPWWI